MKMSGLLGARQQDDCADPERLNAERPAK